MSSIRWVIKLFTNTTFSSCKYLIFLVIDLDIRWVLHVWLWMIFVNVIYVLWLFGFCMWMIWLKYAQSWFMLLLLMRGRLSHRVSRVDLSERLTLLLRWLLVYVRIVKNMLWLGFKLIELWINHSDKWIHFFFYQLFIFLVVLLQFSCVGYCAIQKFAEF